MKFQHVSVLFVIIFIPIILVTSYFISLQVNTIKLQTSYDEKLLNATYDAMTAFELNTANEDLSSVSDSLRSIIDASNNIFFNTLCTNFGISNASKSFVQPYIPAILYTLYDGYYIYSPTNIPEICVDKFGRTITTADYGVTEAGTVIVNGRSIGVYNFDQDSIIYSYYTPTEPAPETTTDPNERTQIADSIDYNTADDVVKSEYGQILYKNNDGTYSTELHTISDRDRSTYYKRDYILKSYIPYAATYSASGIDLTINYTLDNFITIQGTIDGVYYTKSGYLISDNLVTSIEFTLDDGTRITLTDSTDPDAWKKYSEEVLDSYIYDSEHHEVKVNLDEIVIDNLGVTTTHAISISNRDGRVNVSNGTGSGSETRFWDDAKSAVEYYVDSYIFSKWVYSEIGTRLRAENLRNTQYSVSDIQANVPQDIVTQTELYKEMLYDFTGDTSTPFVRNNNDPESNESIFYNHKRNIIKNSITYNLILSMLVYTEDSRTTEFNMPVFDEEEWDRILNNVSIVAFMEGMKCGFKYYNNYAIVTSTNNEISITENEIYYVPRVLQTVNSATGAQILSRLDDDITEYPSPAEDPASTPPDNEFAHRIDCDELVLGDTNNFFNTGTENIWLGCHSFKSKEIKYDKILDSEGRYVYDHKVYTDYDCIVDSNYRVKNVNNSWEDGNTDVLEYLTKNVTNASAVDGTLRTHLEYKLRAYRVAIAKERNNLYKTTAFPENYGWFVQMTDTEANNGAEVSISISNSKPINEIKKIEVTIEGAELRTPGVYTSQVIAKCNNSEYATTQTIATTSAERRTLEFVQDFPDVTENLSQVKISAPDTKKLKVLAVKVYYK